MNPITDHPTNARPYDWIRSSAPNKHSGSRGFLLCFRERCSHLRHYIVSFETTVNPSFLSSCTESAGGFFLHPNLDFVRDFGFGERCNFDDLLRKSGRPQTATNRKLS